MKKTREKHDIGVFIVFDPPQLSTIQKPSLLSLNVTMRYCALFRTAVNNNVPLAKYPTILPDFNQMWKCWTDFRRKTTQDFTKTLPVVAKLIHMEQKTDRRTDGRTVVKKSRGAFRDQCQGA